MLPSIHRGSFTRKSFEKSLSGNEEKSLTFHSFPLINYMISLFPRVFVCYMLQEPTLRSSEIEEPLIWQVAVAACESFQATATYLPLIFVQSLGGINKHFRRIWLSSSFQRVVRVSSRIQFFLPSILTSATRSREPDW